MLSKMPLHTTSLNNVHHAAALALPGPYIFDRTVPGPQRLEAKRSSLVRVLVVEDDPPVREACAEIATSLGCKVQSADSIETARRLLGNGAMDLVLLDLKLPGGGGLQLLEEIRSRFPETTVIIMTAYATVSSAVEAMRIGASDYLTKPFTLDELTSVFERAAQRRDFDQETRDLRDRLRSGKSLGDLVGRSPAMEKLYRILSKVALAAHPVLVLGEPGTGKALVARAIHQSGPKSEKSFITVDCGSLLPATLEAELFGYAKGAMPGVAQAKIGLLASAAEGTVFLDDVDELPLDIQGKLLRALQDRVIRPMGASQPQPICARILASTNRDLPTLVANGRFRKDLYFRLNVVNIRLPPLRERKSDIPLLAAHLLDRMRRDTGTTYTFGDDALRLLVDYEWPGNVTELEHAIECACASSSGPVLHLADFPPRAAGSSPRQGHSRRRARLSRSCLGHAHQGQARRHRSR